MAIASILNSFRKLFKRRQHKRYAVNGGTFVFISSDNKDDREQKVQLIDISQGGMAFIYQGSPSELETSGILKILTKSPYGQKIDFETVSDIPIHGSTQTSEPLRQRSVKFKWMGYFEKSELRNLISAVGIYEK
jgi:c-di-GMP-binding flagellar brake protein YcgR